MPSESESPALQNSLLSPLLTGTESPFDLEQQWQDLMSIMEMQVGLSEKLSLQGGPAYSYMPLQERVTVCSG